jgi:hypothetical protein
MNKSKTGNLAKLVAFFVITVVLTCTVAYAAGEWQQQPNDTTSDNSDDNTEPSDDPSVNVDENKTEEPPKEEIPEPPSIPEYLHYITGLEITKDESYKKPLAFVLDPNAPLYSISTSYLTVELPTESGTRLLCFTDEALECGKIGSILPTRGYISSVASYFDAILLSNGDDGRVEAEKIIPSGGYLDLSDNIGYHYSEYNDCIYTNKDLLTALIKNTKTPTVKVTCPAIPFDFNEYNAQKIALSLSAENIMLYNSDSDTTSFIYDGVNDKYSVSKNDTALTDRITSEELSYDNVFILFANSVTHETSEYTECVLDTTTGGTGKYATGGKYVDITWTVTSEGLLFFDEDGKKLTVNRGTSYISFIKSSLSHKISIK